jgi:hypothetical protein
MQDDIDARSEEGKGSFVRVEIPAVIPGDEVDRPA